MTTYSQSDIDAAIAAAAQQNGIDPRLLSTTAQIESNGNPHAVSPTGAAGLFQFTNGTAKQYGLKNRFDPVASSNAAAKLYKDNAAALSKSLGRAPSNGEQYLAYQQGAKGATALLTAPAGTSAVDALTPVYGSRSAATAAITANGGSPSMPAAQFADKWTGQFNSQVPGEAPMSLSQAAASTPAPSAPGIGSNQPPKAAQDKKDANQNPMMSQFMAKMASIPSSVPMPSGIQLTDEAAQAPPQTPGISLPAPIPLTN